MTQTGSGMRTLRPLSRPTGAFARTAFLTAILLAVLPACNGSDGEAQQVPPDQAPVEDAQTFDLAPMGFNEGDMEDSAVWVVEFSDFGCIFCARFHLETYPELYREFVRTGDVAWKYIPVTIGGFPNGDAAAVVGECAGAQGRFAPVRDRLFEEREEWIASEDPGPLFQQYARDAGVDQDEFVQCLTGDEARRRVSEGNRVAQQIGVTGTPTFIVQGFPVQGAPPLEAFQEVLRDLVTQAREPGES